MKIPNTTNLVTRAALNTKGMKNELEKRDITYLATKVAFNIKATK